MLSVWPIRKMERRKRVVTKMKNWDDEMSITSRVTSSKMEKGLGKNREGKLG